MVIIIFGAYANLMTRPPVLMARRIKTTLLTGCFPIVTREGMLFR